MRQFLILFALVGFLALPGLGSPVAMVTRVTDSGQVVVNRGVEDQVTPGTRWFVYREGKPLAELEVELVDSYTCKAKVVQGGGVRIGDRISDQPFKTAPEPVAAAAQGPAEVGMDQGAAQPPAGSTVAKPTTVLTAEEAEAAYQKLLAGSTKSKEFKGGAQASNTFKIDPYNALNTLTTFGYGGQYWPNLWNLISVGAEHYGTNRSNANLYKDARLAVQVTYWGEPLVEAYADSLALRENHGSIEERLSTRASVMAQKGLDKFLVFSVKLSNRGPGTVQISPFHWHLYVVDAQGNRVKAERYDQVLDRTLNPDQSVDGYIYFMKTDAAGRSLLGPGAVKVVLEDILGERAELSF